MKFIDPHPFADPDAAARKLVEIANQRRSGAGWPYLSSSASMSRFWLRAARAYRIYGGLSARLPFSKILFKHSHVPALHGERTS